MYWDGMEMVEQIRHNIHLNYIAPSKPEEQTILPQHKVLLNSRQKGRKIKWKMSSTLLGRKMSKYFMCEVAHLKEKLVLRRVVIEAGIDTFNASDNN